MFDNVAFNVVLGMVFIYLLYSLLATLVAEIIATWLGIRERQLRFSIERMLNDGYYSMGNPNRSWKQRWTDWRMRHLLQESDEFGNTLAGKFYDYPSIKYLARADSQWKLFFNHSKPAYISAEIFATTLINMLSEKGSGLTQADKVKFALRYNTLHIQPDTLLHLRNLYRNSGDQIAGFNQKLQQWFTETQDRNNGWYKQKIRGILFLWGLLVAICFNVDSIHLARLLASDKEASRQLTNLGVALVRDTAARYKDLLQAKVDSVHTQTVLNHSLSRLGKDLQDAGEILGSGWDFTDSLYSTDVTIDKGKEPVLYGAVNTRVNQFEKIWKLPFSSNTVETLLQHIYQDIDLIDSLRDQQFALGLDTFRIRLDFARLLIAADSNKSALKKDSSDFVSDTNSLHQIRQSLSIDTGNYILHTNLYNAVSREYSRNVQWIDSLAGSNFVTIQKVEHPSGQMVIEGKKQYGLLRMLGTILLDTFFSAMGIGFLLTALALSMGAPFWFDLLSTLVSIRGSGVKPEDKKKKDRSPGSFPPAPVLGGGAAGAGPLPVIPMPDVNKPQPGSCPPDATIDASLDVYQAAILLENGVVSVHKGYFLQGNKAVECLQVNVMLADDKTAIQQKYGSLDLFQHVPLQVDVTGRPRLTFAADVSNPANPKRGLSNINEQFGWGSFGCLMVNNDDATQKFIVSCYHVVNGDYSWDNTGSNRSVKNKNNVVIATNYTGCLNNQLDAAFAGPLTAKVYAAYAPWKPAGKAQPIGPGDIGKKVSANGYASNAQGIIMHDSCPATFPYDISTEQEMLNPMTDLIAVSRLDANNQPIPFSQEGDSGALVLDASGNALGIIVGVDLKQTYIIKIDAIENQFNLSLDC